MTKITFKNVGQGDSIIIEWSNDKNEKKIGIIDCKKNDSNNPILKHIQDFNIEEIDFIYLKWNQKEVDDFVMLVDENLKRLSINPLIGQIHKNVYKLVISKQTSLFYKIIEKDKKVELVYFWNNKKDSQ